MENRTDYCHYYDHLRGNKVLDRDGKPVGIGKGQENVHWDIRGIPDNRSGLESNCGPIHRNGRWHTTRLVEYTGMLVKIEDAPLAQW